MTRWIQSDKSSATASLILILGLAVMLLASAVQPCFAFPMNQSCCGHETGCPHPGKARICAMQSTVFIAPEHDAPGVHLPLSSLAVFAPAVSFPRMDRAAVLTRAPGGRSLYLRNSVLLI